MKLINFGLLIFITINCFSQEKGELYVPIEITYYPGYHYKIPWKEELDKSTWVEILTYPLTNPKESRALFSTNKEEYYKKANKMLYTRFQCDSLITEYVYKASTKIERRKQFADGVYYEQEKSGDRMYWRCVCLPASELKNLGHGEAVIVGTPIKYIEPKDFVFRFGRYKLDSLDLTEAPYFTIFPLDINPSFNCSKATTPIEKAICRDEELADLDKQLSILYVEVVKQKGEEIKSQQKLWLQERDKQCQGKDNEEITKILKKLYFERINVLKN